MTQATQPPTRDGKEYRSSKTYVHSILGDSTHRIMLRVLSNSEEALSLKELTRETLTDEEYDDEYSVSILEGLMVDNHLPVLEAAGVVETDAGYSTIEPGERLEAYLQMSQAVDEVYEQHFGES